MYEFLKSSGLQVGHEYVKEEGLVSWLMTANTQWVPWGSLANKYTFEHTFHQIRHPLKVIQSFYNVPPRTTWEWIKHSIPEIDMLDSDLIKCAKYWYYWNLLAESKAEWSYKIEEFDLLYSEMGARLGWQFDRTVLDGVSKGTNTKVKDTDRLITWTILQMELPSDLYEKIVDFAQKYGYLTVD